MILFNRDGCITSIVCNVLSNCVDAISRNIDESRWKFSTKRENIEQTCSIVFLSSERKRFDKFSKCPRI